MAFPFMSFVRFPGHALAVAVALLALGTAAAAQDAIRCCGETNDTGGHTYIGSINLRANNLDILMPVRQPAACQGMYDLPLTTTQEQAAQYATRVDLQRALLINANFYENPDNPHRDVCGLSIGLAKGGGAQPLSVPGRQLHPESRCAFLPDSLVIFADSNAPPAAIVERPPTLQALMNAVNNRLLKAGVSGLLIVRNGQAYNQCYWNELSPDELVPRTVIGLSRDGALLSVFVVEDDHRTSAGARIGELVEYLLTVPDVYSALMLDGSGSSSLTYLAPVAAINERSVTTQPSDKYPIDSTTLQYRPVPVVLAFLERGGRGVKSPENVYGIRVPPGEELTFIGLLKQITGCFMCGENSETTVTGISSVTFQANTQVSLAAGATWTCSVPGILATDPPQAGDHDAGQTPEGESP